ncbi:hypothetical protein H7Y63_02405 [Polaromonas sp.]|nr:hypothetical protein [Candidatus Saccharibacteria bacterium]
MTTKQPHEIQLTSKNKLAKKALATGLAAAALFGSGIAVGKATSYDGPSKKEQINIAQIEAYNAVYATKLAAQYTEDLKLNKGPLNSLTMRVAHGEVIDRSGRTEPRVVYRDPIILTQYSEDGVLPTKGNILDGAFIGIAGSDANGDVQITAVPYSSTNLEFIPFDPERPELSLIGYTNAGKEGNTLYAYEAGSSQTLSNPDSMPLLPGQSLGMK